MTGVFQGVHLKHVECRTALCKVDFEQQEGPSVNKLELQQTLALLYSPAAAGFGHNGLSFVLAYRGRIRWLRSVPGDDPKALVAAIEQRRRAMMESLRQGEATGTPRTSFHLVNLNKLPAD
jgi:hypothetical protein